MRSREKPAVSRQHESETKQCEPSLSELLRGIRDVAGLDCHATSDLNPCDCPPRMELREFPIPSIGPEEMLPRVGMVAICGSDRHHYAGGAWVGETIAIVGPGARPGQHVGGLPLRRRGAIVVIGVRGDDKWRKYLFY